MGRTQPRFTSSTIHFLDGNGEALKASMHIEHCLYETIVDLSLPSVQPRNGLVPAAAAEKFTASTND